MGDTSEGPSIAAQSAQSDQTDGQRTGFFGRIIEAFSPAEETPDMQIIGGENPTPAARALGLSHLRRMRVEDVSIPKPDIVAVPLGIDKDELVSIFRDSGLTRLPVYDGTLDTPIGFLNLKDFALQHGFNGHADALDLRTLVRPLLYVPPSMPLHILLQKMQADRIHMALVIDEYGGTDGLVTIEDLIEQVVGEIEDEYDVDEDDRFICESPGVYLAQAKTPLEEFEEVIGMDLTADEEIDAEEVDTLGGLVFMLAGHVPARGEVILHPAGPEFEVIDADPRRIKRLRVRLPEVAVA